MFQREGLGSLLRRPKNVDAVPCFVRIMLTHIACCPQRPFSLYSGDCESDTEWYLRPVRLSLGQAGVALGGTE